MTRVRAPLWLCCGASEVRKEKRDEKAAPGSERSTDTSERAKNATRIGIMPALMTWEMKIQGWAPCLVGLGWGSMWTTWKMRMRTALA